MNCTTFDMFADPPHAPVVAVAAANADPRVQAAPTRALPPDRMTLLEKLFGDRKAAFKVLDDEQRVRLGHAVDVLITSRDAAKLRAAAGRASDSFGWMLRDPELADATALLNGHLLDLNSLPMSTGPADVTNAASADPVNH